MPDRRQCGGPHPAPDRLGRLAPPRWSGFTPPKWYSFAPPLTDGQVMELARPLLGSDLLNSDTVRGCRDGDLVRAAGRVVRRQRPLAKAVLLTLEDEWGLIPVAVWEGRWERLKHALRRPLLVIEGAVSRRDNTLNVMAEQARPLSVSFDDRRRRQDCR